MDPQSIDVHNYRYRCPSCPAMVEVAWSDGNGAVAQDPVVMCDNPQCDRKGQRMKLHDVPTSGNKEDYE